jgi:hypothetical protein
MIAGLAARIRRAFKTERGPDHPDAKLMRLQDHLSATCGGAVSRCRCGRGFITPVFNHHCSRVDVVALACTECHEVAGLEEPGLLFERPEPGAYAATVH